MSVCLGLQAQIQATLLQQKVHENVVEEEELRKEEETDSVE